MTLQIDVPCHSRCGTLKKLTAKELNIGLNSREMHGDFSTWEKNGWTEQSTTNNKREYYTLYDYFSKISVFIMCWYSKEKIRTMLMSN